MATLLSVQEINLPEQKYFEGVGHFPFVFGVSDTKATIRQAVDWVKTNKSLIESTLLQHGAILFKNFPTHDGAAFSDFVEAFEYENLPYVGGAAPRKQVVGNVFTANEAPADIDIPFHHEMSNTMNWPKKLFFYGDVAPQLGGETPILLSNEVYKRMSEKHKGFVDELAQKGAKYTRILSAENDETSPQGRGWKATYFVNTKEELEVVLKEKQMEFEWLPNGDVKTVHSSPLPAVQIDARSGKPIWFNAIVAVYTGWNDARHVGEKCANFGDGTPLPKEAVLSCKDIMNEICVNHKWEHGDVLMIDNRLVQHARRRFVGQRRVYAYLTKT